MTADSDQIYYISVNPNEKEISLDMAFHTAFILSFQQRRFVCLWDWPIVYDQIGDIFKSGYLFGGVLDTFEVFFELACGM